MQITHNIPETRKACSSWSSLGFVPTMGALHQGHLSLIRRASTQADHVAVSLFVNPTQFGPNEDYDQYPRPQEKDLALCETEGVDLVFCPRAEVIYPEDEMELLIDVPALTGVLEGAHRHGHFRGVCRVVAKLLSIIQPSVACFGQKDYQQLCVIEAMVAGLNMPIKIDRCPTIREPDGLAMSSRNAYLNSEQRTRGLGLYQSLERASALMAAGQASPESLETAMRQVLEESGCKLDYAVVRHGRDLSELKEVAHPAVCLVAAHVDQVHLIDNRVIA